MSVKVLLLLGAVICFVLKAFNVPAGRVDFLALGLAFWAASYLLN